MITDAKSAYTAYKAAVAYAEEAVDFYAADEAADAAYDIYVVFATAEARRGVQ